MSANLESINVEFSFIDLFQPKVVIKSFGESNSSKPSSVFQVFSG